MSSFELAGQAMLQMHEGNRNLALALTQWLGKLFDTADHTPEPALGSATFMQQEPDLAKETHLPGTYIGTF